MEDSLSSISVVSTMGLSSLQEEPARLKLEADKINNELESLVIDNYRVFVENLTCSTHLRSEDKKLVDVAAELLEDLHGLSQQCTAFRDKVGQFVNFHKRNRKTLQHHMQLIELLEVPQLAEACSRNGFYDEALELANFVNILERKHLLSKEVHSVDKSTRSGNNIVRNIVNEVHQTLKSLKHQIISHLSENASLPKQIQLLATLRKLETLFLDRHISLERFGGCRYIAQATDVERERIRSHYLSSIESKLQMIYLEARTMWINKLTDDVLAATSGTVDDTHSQISHPSKPGTQNVGIIEDAGSENNRFTAEKGTGGHHSKSKGCYGRIIEILEVNRTSWFSVITQYNALFEESHASFPTDALLSTWVTNRVEHLLNDIRQKLRDIEDGSSFRSVLEQTQFFSARMAQIGCDFSASLPALFTDVMVKRLREEWATALANFKLHITTERIVMDGPRGRGRAQKECGSVGDVRLACLLVRVAVRLAECRASLTPYPLPHTRLLSLSSQVIPLYVPTQTSTSSAEAVAPRDSVEPHPNPTPPAAAGVDTNRVTVTSEDLPAPTPLLSYPALAQLLNALLIGLNFVRECPLLLARQAVREELQKVCVETCMFVVQMKDDIRSRGAKLLDRRSTPKQPVQNQGQGQGQGSLESSEAPGLSGGRCLDLMYGEALVDALVPHALFCFHAVYPSTVGTQVHRAEGEARAVKLAGTRDVEGVLEACVDVLRDGGLFVGVQKERSGVSGNEPEGGGVSKD